jgi:integrase
VPQENLPPGFERLKSLSIRVRIRKKGQPPVSEVFALAADTSTDRRLQLQQAKAWAEETRRQMGVGLRINTYQAERLTLGEALSIYSREGLKGKESNVRKDRNRINRILSDPIAERSVAAIRKVDINAYQNRLILKAQLSKIDSAIRRLEGNPENRVRISSLKELKKLRNQSISASDTAESHQMAVRIAEIEKKEKIVGPARTTIGNTLQLISRALKHVGQTVEGVPDVSGVKLPTASPARDRRLSSKELNTLISEAAKLNSLLPVIIKFAIDTCLRREKIFEFAPSLHIREIGSGKRAIAFRKRAEREKRTGVVPITSTLDALISEAVAINGENDDPSSPLFQIDGSSFDQLWQSAKAAAHISDYRFHDLRHEGTSALFERGLSTAEVMSVTGHSTTEMVDRYSHYSAALVHAKLETGLDPDSLLEEIGFLILQFRGLGGNLGDLRRLVK